MASSRQVKLKQLLEEYEKVRLEALIENIAQNQKIKIAMY